MRRGGSLFLLALAACSQLSIDEQLRTAEDEAEREDLMRQAVGADGTSDELVDRLYDDYKAGEWAAGLREIVLSNEGVDDEVIPSIAVGDTEAELMEATVNAFAVLKRKQQASGLIVEVLESQLVVAYGVETKAQRRNREAAGLGVENKLASELACRDINGTALFLLVRRKAVEGAPHVHEVGFFDRDLWEAFLTYMGQARQSALYGGDTPFHMRMHWNVLPINQRVPFQLTRPQLRVVAEPTVVAQHQHFPGKVTY